MLGTAMFLAEPELPLQLSRLRNKRGGGCSNEEHSGHPSQEPSARPHSLLLQAQGTYLSIYTHVYVYLSCPSGVLSYPARRLQKQEDP